MLAPENKTGSVVEADPVKRMQRHQLLIRADRFADPHTYSVGEHQRAQADKRLDSAASAQAVGRLVIIRSPCQARIHFQYPNKI